MSLLDDLIFSSCDYHGRGMFRFGQISFQIKIKSINGRQRKKFKKLGLIPQPALEVLWDLEFLPGEIAQGEGMRIPLLMSFLKNGRFRNQQNKANGLWLLEKIIKEEIGFSKK